MAGLTTTLRAVKKVLLLGLLAVPLGLSTGLATVAVAAEPVSKLWSIAVHIEYQDGFEYDYVFASGVPTSIMPSILAECGRSHRTGSVVRYHCFPIAE